MNSSVLYLIIISYEQQCTYLIFVMNNNVLIFWFPDALQIQILWYTPVQNLSYQSFCIIITMGFMVNSVLYPLIICYEQQCTDILISWCIADEELLKMVQDVSEDPVYHTIEFNEFLQLLSKQQRSGTTRDSLTDAFRFVSHFRPRALSYFLIASLVSFLTASCNRSCN